ncbi:hypothetical protein EX30DRAFT_366058 [Ascodesmis nigricans]|uniref:Uncharacterized protein n=1 Tax=Ascodesmis nigricans TaxID=341454 RepID=A0A4S2MN56_9PEZI|nr:hypothetical protein EX30DRAFT_366058 [Ascodesmis nigricans]
MKTPTLPLRTFLLLTLLAASTTTVSATPDPAASSDVSAAFEKFLQALGIKTAGSSVVVNPINNNNNNNVMSTVTSTTTATIPTATPGVVTTNQEPKKIPAVIRPGSGSSSAVLRPSKPPGTQKTPLIPVATKLNTTSPVTTTIPSTPPSPKPAPVPVPGGPKPWDPLVPHNHTAGYSLTTLPTPLQVAISNNSGEVVAALAVLPFRNRGREGVENLLAHVRDVGVLCYEEEWFGVKGEVRGVRWGVVGRKVENALKNVGGPGIGNEGAFDLHKDIWAEVGEQLSIMYHYLRNKIDQHYLKSQLQAPGSFTQKDMAKPSAPVVSSLLTGAATPIPLIGITYKAMLARLVSLEEVGKENLYELARKRLVHCLRMGEGLGGEPTKREGEEEGKEVVMVKPVKGPEEQPKAKVVEIHRVPVPVPVFHQGPPPHHRPPYHHEMGLDGRRGGRGERGFHKMEEVKRIVEDVVEKHQKTKAMIEGMVDDRVKHHQTLKEKETEKNGMRENVMKGMNGIPMNGNPPSLKDILKNEDDEEEEERGPRIIPIGPVRVIPLRVHGPTVMPLKEKRSVAVEEDDREEEW